MFPQFKKLAEQRIEAIRERKEREERYIEEREREEREEREERDRNRMVVKPRNNVLLMKFFHQFL
ncbi:MULTISPECIES: hypothetical protein [Microcystis]|nr:MULTISPECIES: hypothetical protein [Microcystis]BAG05452.1 unknown protein [Microcystis aeruginosa NIES-843]